jgi:hypothetical protein
MPQPRRRATMSEKKPGRILFQRHSTKIVDHRKHVLALRVNDAEYALLAKRANKLGMPISDLLRICIETWLKTNGDDT